MSPSGGLTTLVIGVEGAVCARPVVLEHQWRAADDRCAGGGLQGCSGRAVIAVGVGAHDGGDVGIANGSQDGLDMTFTVDIGRVADALAATGRTGVDDRDIAAVPYQPGLRAGIGVG